MSKAMRRDEPLAGLRAQFMFSEGNFQAVDTMAVELEVAELLYALVRAMKPEVVVEAGSGKGYASVFIASALQANGFGILSSYEQDPTYAAQARDLLWNLPAVVVDGFSHEYKGAAPDLVFLDSLGGPEGRDQDLAFWLAREHSVVVVHDANGYPDLPGSGVRLTAGRGVWIGHA